MPRGLPWQEPDGGWGDASRPDRPARRRSTPTGRHRGPPGRLRRGLRRLGRRSARRIDPAARRTPPARPPRLRDRGRAPRCAGPSATRPGSPTPRRWPCSARTAPSWTRCAALADDLRRDVVGDDVTYVVNRNINFTNVCYTGCRFCAFAQRRTDADAYTLSLDQVGDRAEEAWAAGATEVCMQGGIHPDLPGTAYFDIAAEVRRRCPDLHMHAFSPMEVDQRGGADRAVGPRVADPGPGGRARLDAGHRRGDPRRRRPLGADQGQAARRGLDRGDHHRARAGPADDRRR